jgi:hypothetical protein
VEQDRAPPVLPHHHELARTPLTSHEVVVNCIAATVTRAGLTVHAELDDGSYPTGRKISDAETDALPLARHDWHGDWNYTLRPEPPARPPAGPGTSAWAHPALTGLDPAQWDQLTAALHTTADEPPPIHLSLADQAFITVLRLRYRITVTALAQLYGVSATTIRTAQDHAWPLLVRTGYPTETAGPTLRTLPRLTAYAREHGIALTPKTNGLFLRDSFASRIWASRWRISCKNRRQVAEDHGNRLAQLSPGH